MNMNQMGSSGHHRALAGKRHPKTTSASDHLKRASPDSTQSKSAGDGAGEAQKMTDHLLRELEWQRTLVTAQVREVEQLRRQLRASEELFDALYKKAPIGYLTLSERGNIVDANPAAMALFNLTADRLSHLPFTFLVHPKEISVFLKHLARCKDPENWTVTTEVRIRSEAEESRRIQIISLPVVRGLKRFFLTAVLDVTDRVRSQVELAEAKEFSESIVEAVSQPLAVLDSDLKIVSVNRAFVQLFRQPAEFACGRVFEVMLHLWWSGNALRAELEKVLLNDDPLEGFEIQAELRDVGKRVLLLNARRLQCKRGAHPLLLVAMEDITARKLAAEQMRLMNQELETRVASRTEALKKSYEQMESFCYSIAHDLRAPLRSMTGFSSILLDDYASRLDERGRDYVGRIHESAARMDMLIKDLLNYGRLNTAGLEIQDVNLDETFRILLMHQNDEIKEKRATIRKKGTLPLVRGHPVVLQTILANLLSNAMKFVAPGVKPVIVVSTEERGEYSRIWVEDNGIGIAPQNRAKIFGVFQRLHASESYPGTGIGLAIVHKGVERMGGRVGVESEPNKGSRFWIELPRAGAGKKEPTMASQKSPAAEFVSR